MTCGDDDDDTACPRQCACDVCDGCENEVWDDDGTPPLCDGCAYVPTLEDAFHKFGHHDGGSCTVITGDVVRAIEACGPYDCGGHEDAPWYESRCDWRDGWGCHNCAVITRIVRTDTGAVVYPPPGFRIGGYDSRDVAAVLPPDIAQAVQPFAL